MKVTAQQVFDYADRYARRHENTGKGTQYPTVRQAARRFKVKQATIRRIVEGSEGCGWHGYFGLAVAIGIPGIGYADLAPGDQLIEAYR